MPTTPTPLNGPLRLPEDIIISIRDLVTHYGNRPILQGINLDIRRGETMVILGRSGCGKSTLLRHLVGLALPTSGQIIIKGYDLAAMSEGETAPVLRKMGMLFQGAALFNSMTVGDNVALPLREHTRLEESTIKIMTRIKLELVGLAGFENFMPAQLSGGMKKRAGLARAIAMDPEILFCDEPSAGLDPVVAVGIDELILKLKRAFNMTTVVVTHELASVFKIADRIAMLHEGQIVAMGTPEELRDNAHPIVQQFFNRLPDAEELNSEAYLNTLVGA
ncbi:ABC transporter ATP-binding protein [candidate division KSB1 bacterium]|nr:MAG: ABC transporter ATP-binding protein [candidate division KSB1 bacterium]MBC6950909.1 ABC transporter ATP-binding protein [candidate division KSB1 bacterium]MCE7944745.1 ABC transporter ATP-binding protein [Chlorobi bacterium CHB1]MDL1877256.1 ABC transporter ATP-binding protein [Cytophagia bacterium CHB2]